MLAVAAVILFGGLKETLLQFGVKDFAAMFCVLAVVFANLFKALVFSGTVSLAYGGALLLIFCAVVFVKKAAAKNYVLLAGLPVVVGAVFLCAYYMNQGLVSVYWIYTVCGAAAVLSGVLFAKDGAEGFALSYIGLSVGYCTALAVGGERVILFGGEAFSLAVCGALLTLLGVVFYAAAVRTVRRVSFRSRFEAGSSVEKRKEGRKRR